MNSIDMLLVEDDNDTVDIIGMLVPGEMKHYAVDSYEQLEEALGKYNANVYVVDGNFPTNSGGNPQFLAEKAIKLIKERKGSHVKIIIYSKPTSTNTDLDLQNLAETLQVEYRNKLNTKYGELIELVQSMSSQ